MTQGDVFSVVAAIFGIFLTAWASVVAIALLCPGAVDKARLAVAAPGRAIFHGLAILLTLGLLGVVLLVNPLPLLKLVGWVVTLALLACASVGLSGISQAAGRRIQDLDPMMPAYPAMVRGAAYVVGATILPVLGWFAFGPLLLLASIGAGWKAVVFVPGRALVEER